MKNIFKLQKSLGQDGRRFDVNNLNHSTEYKKEEKTAPVSDYLSEGNPNTQQKIDEARGQDPKQSTSSAQQENTGAIYTDRQLQDEITKAIQKEETVSADDRSNVAVSVEEGIVTLVGTISSEQKKRTLGDKAVAFVGPGKVRNQLDVS